MEKRELSLSASSLLQDETTLIVARPAEKIKRRSHEIFSSFFFLRLQEFRKKLGNTDCSELVKVYKKDDVRCLETVCLAADVFEEFYNTLIAEK